MLEKLKKSQRTLPFLFHVTGRNRLGILALTVLQMMLGFSSVCFAMLMRGAIDGAVAKEQPVFWRYLFLLVGLVVLQILFRAVVRFLEEDSRSSIENALKHRLFATLLTKQYAQVAHIHSGEWINRLTSNTGVTANGIVEIVPNLSGMLVKLIGAIVMILFLEPGFAFLLVPGGIMMIFFTYAFRKVLKRLHKGIQESDGELRIFLQERLGSLMLLKAFAVEEITERGADERMQGHKRARMKRNHFSNFCNIGFAAAMNGMYLIGFAYCSYGILRGSISYGTLMAILQLISQVQSPFANITGYLPKFYAMTASAERLMEAEEFSDDVTFAEDDRKKEFSEILLENISFRYPGENQPKILDGFSMRIHKGDYIAFTGHSGCGKSTVFKILLSLYPVEAGRVTYLGDGEQIPPRSLFAYVPQGNQLMQGTIREIITFANVVGAAGQENQEKRIERALRIACATQFVKELEDGVDTLLGERGAGLSEGQMQRIAIARAIYANNPVLLLDEATSSLDEATERQVLLNLKEMTDKTVLIVTHRPAALSICNRVVEFGEK